MQTKLAMGPQVYIILRQPEEKLAMYRWYPTREIAQREAEIGFPAGTYRIEELMPLSRGPLDNVSEQLRQARSRRPSSGATFGGPGDEV